MKTLADFKRAIQVGSVWRGYNHYYKSEFPARRVSKVQSESFAFERVNDDGTTTNSWCDFPKAKNIEFGADGEVKIFTEWCDEERFHLLSYWKI